jgi:D-arabinose 1-dehydrogenase-like Zn-dependent alcohol dehydrogenase
MSTMRRLVLEEYGRPLQLRQVERPVPAGTEVLVRVTRCGICHTDLHLRDGHYDLGGGRQWRFADRGLVPPITPGHEIAGEIVAAGPAGGGVGRRGVVYPWIGCGTCAVCGRGSEDLCPTPRFLGMRRPGGYGEYVIVPHERYVLDVGDVDPAQAASLGCAGLTAWSALAKVADSPGWLGIVGAGGIGLAAIALARTLGRDRIVAFEIDARRRAAALEAGAEHAVDPRDAAAVAAIAAGYGEAAAASIDFVGRPETFTLGTDILRRGGRYVIVGLFGGETPLVLPMLALRAISIAGSAVGSFAEMQALVALARAGRLPALPTALRPLEAANASLDDLHAGRVVGRVVLDPESAS